MSNGGKRDGAGRPPAGRTMKKVRMTQAAWDRLDTLRKGKPRGAHLEKMIDAQPLSPFEKFNLLRKDKQ
jgi:hypothetical protein